MFAFFKVCLYLMLLAPMIAPMSASAVVPFQNNYPDGNKPCLSGDPRNPSSSYGKTSGSGYWCPGYSWGNLGGSEYSSRGYSYRNCTDWAAFRAPELTGRSVPRNLGNANTWDDHAPASWVKDGTPEPGDIAQTDAGSYGHVGVVEEVKRNDAGKISSVTISAYNARQDGTYSTETSTPDASGAFRRLSGSYWKVFLDLNGTDRGINGESLANGAPMDNTVLKVIKRTQRDGVNLVYWAKAGTVFESWWRPGGDGVHLTNLVGITQQDIKAIDAQLRPDGQHLLYTATAHNVWETWWYPGQSTHTSVIIQNTGNIRDIQKTLGPDGNEQLYIMTDQGVDEYWWRPGGEIRQSRVYTLAQPVAFKKFVAPDGEQLLYIADQSYAYEASWGGDSLVRVRQTLHISQRDITSLDGAVDNDGQRRIYAGRRRDGVWESLWYPGQAARYRQITGDRDVRVVTFYRDGAIPVVYVATAGGVFEYWWLPDGGQVRGSVITALADVRDFERAISADGAQAVYIAANTRVFESWWWPGGSGVRTKPIA